MNTSDSAKVKPFVVTLKNGRKMTIRLLEPTDGEGFVEFYAAISPEDSRYYFSAADRTREKALARVAQADRATEVCLVIDGGDGRIYGEAWFRWNDEENAKSVFGICISRELQGLGVGKSIMNYLMELATDYGPELMAIEVQKENNRALKLYMKLGFKIIREQLRPARTDCEELPEYYMERKTR